ncbi:RidA family protein [Nocardiopsis sp. NRRL B-16309]|uniref:RidA family protein n=1 Tax=Nocardiopsis sp. NRRL B-16309 TaxID=1519494 RepID=UPI0006B04EB3|nr:RidA family protein [Nocardiopsis sp. NRRL B-16309]KOX12627.1 endoribonuclease L-PSP [Nocardiopsis sp. NRRL B-16309]
MEPEPNDVPLDDFRPNPMLPTPHSLVNPPELGPPVGFSHAVVTAPGTTVHLAGQIASGVDGRLAAEGITAQFDLALANVVTAVRAAGAAPEHLVNLTVYTTDVAGYRAAARDIGRTYRRHLGRHYPAMALFGVTELYEPGALVELVGLAVIPD